MFTGRRHPLILITTLWIALAFWIPPEARADIYIYIDDNGVLHFTNTPTSGNYKLYMRETPSRPANWRNNRSYDDVISEAADITGLSFSLLKAVIHVESYFDPRAVSKKGAMGLMQIMPVNFGPLNISDPFDPWENIMGGAHYLKSMLEQFDHQLPLALAAYNAGPTAVTRYNDIPPFPETRDYVQKVMRFFNFYNKQ
ncbi:MAG: lytic transglycosylase domain-containing protein [Desulfatitalea sp.]|nr:lytic transglycosylase domain-containing protein [Desulfatitalea sp.]